MLCLVASYNFLSLQILLKRTFLLFFMRKFMKIKTTFLEFLEKIKKLKKMPPVIISREPFFLSFF